MSGSEPITVAIFTSSLVVGGGIRMVHGALGTQAYQSSWGKKLQALGSWYFCLEPPSFPRESQGPTLAFGDPGCRLSYLALVDGPVLGSASEDAHGEETTELTLGLEGGRETWAERKGVWRLRPERRNLKADVLGCLHHSGLNCTGLLMCGLFTVRYYKRMLLTVFWTFSFP